MPQSFWSITWNIISWLIIAVLLIPFWQWIKKKLKYRAFKQVFGDDLDDFYVVYPSYLSPSRSTTFQKPTSIVPRPQYSTINLTTINSNASTRCVSYLSHVIGNSSPSLPHIVSDIDVDQRMDISFVSVGGLNNYKSLDVLENLSNVFLQFGQGGIESRTSGVSIANVSGNTDYGLILKIHPENNPNRTWICIAGIGEWGTSGASWWLSRHWKTIYKRTKANSFACITRTTYGSDDSTSLVHLFLSQEAVENAVV